MGLQAVVRFFLPRADHFYEFLERQAAVAHDGAVALARFRGDVGPTEVRDAVQTLEHEGDKIVHELEEALARTFVTPIDREDLHELSSELDDILDLANGAARACVLLGVERATPPMVALQDHLLRATDLIRTTVPKLRTHQYTSMIEAARNMSLIEKEADAVFRQAISELFRDSAIDAKVLLRNKEVLDDLENAIDHCDYVAGRLKNLAVKHG